MPDVLLILISLSVGAASGVASRWGTMQATKDIINRYRLNHKEELSAMMTKSSDEKMQMQLEIDGLKSQICTERDLNNEYRRDLATSSQSLKLEKELSATLYEALIVQEPKIKRQFDLFNKAKKMYLELRK